MKTLARYFYEPAHASPDTAPTSTYTGRHRPEDAPTREAAYRALTTPTQPMKTLATNDAT